MEHRRSPNVLSLGDVVRVCLPWASCSFLARIIGFPGNRVRIENVERSDDPEVQNEHIVAWKSIGKRGRMDDRYGNG